MRTIKYLALLPAVLLLLSSLAYADDFGIIMDFSGSVQVVRWGKALTADIGVGLQSGDKLRLGEKAAATVVSYSDCREWEFIGPVEASVSAPLSSKNPKMKRKLPYCYDPSKVREKSAQVAGGYIMRGVSASQSSDFGADETSNTAIISRLMDALSDGNQEEARKNYELLIEREPDSYIAKAFAPDFATSMPDAPSVADTSSLPNVRVEGNGYGPTEDDARKAALADLSSTIQVEVKSEFKSVTTQTNDNDYEKNAQNIINLTSNLPIIGSKVETQKTGKEYLAKALLESRVSLPLYKAKLREIAIAINAKLDAVKSGKAGVSKYDTLQSVITDIEEYSKYGTVALFLGDNNTPQPPVSKSDVSMQLKALETRVESIDLAAELVARGLKDQSVFVYPPFARGSNETTQFAAAVRDRISRHVKAESSPAEARYLLKGEYAILSDGIELTYHLLNSSGGAMGTKVILLTPESYAGYQIKPSTIAFDKLLHEGVAVSADFKVEIATNKGSEGLLFTDGEEVELLVKSNRPCYFYMVDHIITPKEKYSHLVELQEADGNRRFVYFINADDVNKWISIGKFDVQSPFGIESVQIVASTEDLASSVPPSSYDWQNKLHKVSDNPSEGVLATRALGLKKTGKSLSAENVLMFTTMKE